MGCSHLDVSTSKSNSDFDVKPSSVKGEHGGTVSVFSASDAEIESIASDSFANLDTGKTMLAGANGGDIQVFAQGILDIGEINSSSRTFSQEGLTQAGNGGNIFLLAGQDIIFSDFIESYADAQSDFGSVVAQEGGNIALWAGRDISGTGQLKQGVLRLINASSLALVFKGMGNAAGGDSGDVSLSAGRNISVGDFFAYSYALSKSGNMPAGKGGDISLNAGGKIDINNLLSASYASSNLSGSSGTVIGAQGGKVSLNSGTDLHVRFINSASSSSSSSSAGSVTGGNGGEISLGSTNGNILFKREKGNKLFEALTSGSFASASLGNPIGGKGGKITLNAPNGRIAPKVDGTESKTIINSVSYAEKGKTFSGGEIEITAKTIDDLNLLALSSLGQSGNITLGNASNLTINNTSVIASKQAEFVIRSGTSTPAGDLNTSPSSVSLDIGREGRSGSISIEGENSGTLTLTNSSFLSDTSGTDSAGKIDISHWRDVLVEDTVINNSTQSKGNAGSLNIEASNSFTLQGNNSRILARTTNAGNAGKIDINAPKIIIDAAEISSSTTATGKAGDITFTGEKLTLRNGGRIFAFTGGPGDGSTVSIKTTEAVQLGEGVQDSAPVISVEAEASGKAGDVIIETPKFILSDTAKITATAKATATNPEGGGSITLSASQMDLAGKVEIVAETEGQSKGGQLTLQPYQRNNPYRQDLDLNINLFNGSKISASTSGSGSGGGIKLTAPHAINIQGPGIISAETESFGQGGAITVEAASLTLSDGATLSTTARLLPLKDRTQTISVPGNIQTSTIDIDSGGRIPAQDTKGSSTFTFNVPAAQAAQIIQDLDVRFSAAHTYTGDLKVSLRSPSGEVLELINQLGGSGDNFQDTKLNDDATTSIVDSTNPFSGEFSLDPNQPSNLSIFNGENATGQWKLEVEDVASADTGTLFKKGENSPWRNTLGTQLILTTQEVSTETIDITPRPISSHPNIGKGGAIDLNIDTLNVIDGAKILAETEGFTKGGDITIQPNKTGTSQNLFINLDNNSLISASTKKSQNAAPTEQIDGTGGTLKLTATNLISISGLGELSASTSTSGEAGQIEIQSKKLTLDNKAKLSTSTSSGGSGGALILNVSEQLNLRNQSTLSAKTTNVGDAGNIALETPIIDVQQGSKIETSTEGNGAAGNINFDLAQFSSHDSIHLTLRNSKITAETTSNGTGGDISFNAPQSIDLIGNGEITAQTSATGSAGNVDITTNHLTLDQGITLSTTAEKEAPPPANKDEKQANVRLNANEMNLFGKVRVLSETKGDARAGSLTLKPNKANDLNINLRDQSEVSASTYGIGSGGNLKIEAPRNLIISGQGSLSAKSKGKGQAGAIEVKAQNFTLQDGAELST